MSVKFQNIDMTNLSPYTGKFIGYELKEGKMNVELDYKINDSQMKGKFFKNNPISTLHL